MRVYLIALLGLTLLFSACASQRGADAGIAPSERAMMEDDDSGWSVPPGHGGPEETAASRRADGPDDDGIPAGNLEKLREREAEAGDLFVDTGEREAPGTEEARAEQRLRRERQERATAERRRVQSRVDAVPARLGNPRVEPLRTVFFGFDRWHINEDMAEVLSANAAWLKENPGVRVSVEGHCDERGTAEYNLGLGARRAEAVRSFLVAEGVDPERLLAVTYGEEMPLAEGHNEEAWRMNRRVEFTFVDSTASPGDTARPQVR